MVLAPNLLFLPDIMRVEAPAVRQPWQEDLLREEQ